MRRKTTDNSLFFSSCAGACIALAMVMLFTSTGTAADAPPKDPSLLKFGARADAAPLSYRESNKWKGYSVDLCRSIFTQYQEEYARHQQSVGTSSRIHAQDLEFTAIAPSERMASLVEGRIDILCGATTVTIARMKQVDFTLLTFVSGAGIMKKKGTDSSHLTQAKNKAAESRMTYVGCTDGTKVDCTTTQNWITERFGSAITHLPKSSHTEAFHALESEEADFYVGDRVILEYKLRNSANAGSFDLAPSFLTFEPYAIAIAKGNDLLMHSANATLARLYRTGKANRNGGIYDIYDRYFKNDPSRTLEYMYTLQAFPE